MKVKPQVSVFLAALALGSSGLILPGRAFTLAGAIAATPVPCQVFVLVSKPSSSYAVGMREIRQALASRGVPANFTLFDFDHRTSRGMTALARIRKGHFKLVIAMGSEATAFLWAHYRNGRLPVVTAIAKDPVLMGLVKTYDAGSGTNFAFTSLNVPVVLQMQYIEELLPNLKNLAVMFSPKNKSAVQTQYLPLLPVGPRFGVRILAVSAGAHDVAGELRRAMPEAITEMRQTDPDLRASAFWITGSTEIFDQIHLIDTLAGRIPVLSAVPDVVKPGPDSATVAIGVTFEDDGYLAGLYAADILSGRADPATMKVGVVSPPDIAISFLKAHEDRLEIPFDFFELASFVYDRHGRPVRLNGQAVHVQRVLAAPGHPRS